MKKQLFVLAVAFTVIPTLFTEALAADCNNPPTGSYGPAWASQYQSWCVACCGTFSMAGGNPSCSPGSNWGCRGRSSSGGSSGAVGGLYQPFYGLGYSIGQSIGEALFGDPVEEARRRAERAIRAENEAQSAKLARIEAEAKEAARKAEEARKKQETFDRLSSQLQLSEGFSSQRSDLTLMLGDNEDGLRPQGTSFFGLGGGPGGSNLNNNSKVVDLRPRQGNSLTTAAPANPGGALPLMLGDPDTDPNVVDLRDKKAPLVVDPPTAKGEPKPAGSGQGSPKPITVSSSASSSTSRPPITDPNVVDLRDVNPTKDSQGLMKHQWEMSIDWRYRNDPVVQQYIHNLWASAFSSDEAKAQAAGARLDRILFDQMRANGRSPQQIDEFFGKIKTFLTGEEPVPRKWERASKLAQELDADDGRALSSSPKTEKQLAKELKKAESIKADVFYMAPGAQTKEDCVLYAIANGAQVPLKRVNETFIKTVKNLGMDRLEDRQDPNLIVTTKKHGGRGLNPIEQLLVADQLGETIAIPNNTFARAISTTGKPVMTTVRVMDGKQEVGRHEVVVTGVYRLRDGGIYYAVMDSNLVKHKNFTRYVEKSEFEESMAYEGGFVVVPRKNP
jgi:hypothetical protein